MIGDEDNEQIIAAGSFYLDRSTNMAEIAFTVTEDYRGQGLTKYMVNKLTEIAQEKGISGFIGEILAENYPMMHIIKTTPFKVEFRSFGDTFEFSFKFQDRKQT